MARKENVAPQQEVIDASKAVALSGNAINSAKENAVDQKTVFSQVQQLGSEWFKTVTESTTRFAAELADVQKFEKQSIAKAISAVDEATRVAKEAISTTEQLAAQWRKVITEYAQRSLDILSSKN